MSARWIGRNSAASRGSGSVAEVGVDLHVTEAVSFTMANNNLDQFKLVYTQSNGVTGTAEMVRQ